MVMDVTAGAARRSVAALGGAVVLAAAMGGGAWAQPYPPAPDFSDAVSLLGKAAPAPAATPSVAPSPTPTPTFTPAPTPATTPAAELLSHAPEAEAPAPRRLALLETPGPQASFQPAPEPAPLPSEFEAPAYGVQVAAYQSREDARAARDRLSAQIDVLERMQARAERVERAGGALYRLKFGPYDQEADAAAACATLKASGADCFVRDFSGEPLG